MPKGGTGMNASDASRVAGRHLNELATVRTNGTVSMRANTTRKNTPNPPSTVRKVRPNVRRGAVADDATALMMGCFLSALRP